MRTIPWLLVIAWGLTACARPARSDERAIVETRPEPPVPETAIAEMNPASGSTITGSVRFDRTPDGIEVRVDLRGVKPGEHGFHIHEKGDCSAPDATSAGDHFNPEHAGHGDRTDSARHVGDLGNLRADSQGHVEASFVDDRLTFTGEHSILGRAVIVHAQPDDLLSQPGGNAGAREACGVITPRP